MAKREKKQKLIVLNIQHRKLKPEQFKPHKKPGVISLQSFVVIYSRLYIATNDCQ